jgi:hypothetical protein
LTPECEHSSTSSEAGVTRRNVTIGPDVAVVLGWSLAFEAFAPFPERIVILLTRGERNVRWLAVVEDTVNGRFDPKRRKTMIRVEKCCDSCALLHIASLDGEWVLVL